MVSLLPNWPYATFPLEVNAAEQAQSLAIIPDNAVVLTYPYATSFADQAMLWQLLDHMRFRILGGYALTRDARGTASVAPEVLGPKVVEATLIEVSEETVTEDIEGARLVALNMALNGTPRDETDRYLSENFELDDRQLLLDEVYSSVAD